MNGFTLNAGGSTIINAATGKTLALGAQTSRSTGGTVNFNPTSTGTITTSQTTTNSILDPWETYTSSAGVTSYATETSSTIGAYSGATAATAAGTTTSTTNYSVASNTSLTLSAASTGYTLQFLPPGTAGASTVNATTTNTLTLNGILATNPAGATIAGGDLLAGANKELVIMGPSALSISSVIENSTGGASAVTYSSSGTLTLSGTNTFTGGLYVDGGTIAFTAEANLGGTGDAVTLNGGTLYETSLTASFTTTHTYSIGAGGGTFNIAGSSPWTGAKMQFSTANQISGSGTLTKTGGGDMYITQNQSFTGAWNINGGFVEVTTGGSLGTNVAGNTVTVNNGGELTGNGATIPNQLTLNTGSVLATDDDANVNTKFSGNISLGGAATISPANFYSGNTQALVVTASGIISGSGSLTETISNRGYTPTGNGLDGTVIVSGANTYTGGTTLTNGIFQIGVSSATTGSGATLAITSGATGTGLLTVNGGVVDLSSFNLTVGGLAGTGGTIASSSTGTAGSLTIVTGATPETYSGKIANTTSNYTTTFNTATAGNKTVSLAVDGTGTQILAGANTFSGGTTVNSGTLGVGVSSVTTGSGSTMAITSGATGTGLLTVNGGTVDLSTFNLAVAGLAGTGGTIASSSTTTAGSLTILAPATPQTFAGTIADTTGAGNQTVSVAIDGTGTQIFSGADTYSGGTIINSGTLTISGAGTLGATTGTLHVNNTSTGTGTNVVLNLSTSAPTVTGSLSGTIATPTSGINTATINNGGQLFTVNQTAPGAYAGVIAAPAASRSATSAPAR